METDQQPSEKLRCAITLADAIHERNLSETRRLTDIAGAKSHINYDFGPLFTSGQLPAPLYAALLYEISDPEEILTIVDVVFEKEIIDDIADRLGKSNEEVRRSLAGSIHGRIMDFRDNPESEENSAIQTKLNQIRHLEYEMGLTSYSILFMEDEAYRIFLQATDRPENMAKRVLREISQVNGEILEESLITTAYQYFAHENIDENGQQILDQPGSNPAEQASYFLAEMFKDSSYSRDKTKELKQARRALRRVLKNELKRIWGIEATDYLDGNTYKELMGKSR